MPNVQLPPKESNLFKRILVSGRWPSPGDPLRPRVGRAEQSGGGGDGACAAGLGPPGSLFM